MKTTTIIVRVVIIKRAVKNYPHKKKIKNKNAPSLVYINLRV